VLTEWAGGSVNPISPTQIERAVAVGVFDRDAQAQQAVKAVRGLGLGERQVSALRSGDGDLRSMLLTLGVPEGEVRFYADEAERGCSLVVVEAAGRYDEVRGLLQSLGAYDVQARGAELVRGDESNGTDTSGRGRSTPPRDLTTRWEDVRSRYEMLFGQHYGTRGSWEQSEPLYRIAWGLANTPEYRGRTWDEVEPNLRQMWETERRSPPWEDAAGPLRDVFEDVADEARMGLEGGADFRTRKPLE
jgi:hypothetical protein